MLKIPQRFKQILDKDPKMAGVVMQTMADYGEILEENKLYFFEEYTDHGVRHIQSVLDFSEVLIQEKTWSVLEKTPQSIGVYILAVILHDLGMHITCEGLHALIEGQNDATRIKGLDNKTWKELWEKYLDEARRLGDKERVNIIGDKYWLFRIPDLSNRDTLTGYDKKLIGEFVRRHHPRMAHEIAVNGLPAPDGAIPFASGLQMALRDISGLVARSHGMEIRDTWDYLKDEFDETWIRPYNVEVVFLMVVLRISDYCQIDASRLPTVLLRIKNFRSPVSRTEHYKHEDMPYAQEYHKDPESLIFHCKPRNSSVFIRLKNLLQSLQQEFDHSWAILGEIYGRGPDELNPHVQYRRVRSNIDNVAKFANRVDYIPEQISFVVSSELSKLLIGPLYGNDPTYGVRELIQNAVDACRAREFLEKERYEGVIRVSLFERDGQNYFSIEDNGIGMSLDTIKNYYLSIGTSLRVSPQWKRTFMDDYEHSKVQRSGKFGIGVLAAFLLGEKIKIETKALKGEEGLLLEIELADEQIEVKKVEKKKIGTRIEIPISEYVLDLLMMSNRRFDKWYVQSSPRIIYDHKDLGYRTYTPGYSDSLPEGWYELPQNKFNKVIWSYDTIRENGDFYSPSYTVLACNGILVPEAIESIRKDFPFVSVFDFDGKLNLQLNRNGLDGPLPFERELLEDIHKKFLIQLLTARLEPVFNEKGEMLVDDFSIQHPMNIELELLLGEDGFILPASYFMKRNRGRTILGFAGGKRGFYSPLHNGAFIHLHFERPDLRKWVNQPETRIFLTKAACEELENEIKYGGITFYSNKYKKQSMGDNLFLFSNEEIRPPFLSADALSYLEEGACYIIESAVTSYLSDHLVSILEPTLSNVLYYYLEGHPVIPYDIEERKELFPKAFKELQRFFH